LPLRAIVDGHCAGRWADPRLVAALLAHCEVNYGLFALEEELHDEVWLQEEERHYVAITGSLGCGTHASRALLEDLDRLTGRSSALWPSSASSAAQRPGPEVVVPPGQGPLSSGYQVIAACGRLCEHDSPWHSPSREKAPNHSKMIARQLWDASRQAPYGWVYVGSHNLTAAAWGVIHRDEGGEHNWVGNRELGILFVHPKIMTSSEAGNDISVFAKMPLPFGLPPRPAGDISHRFELETDDEVDEEESPDWDATPDWEASADWQSSEWQPWQPWQGTDEWASGQWQSDQGWAKADDSDDSERSRDDKDWRLKRNAWWWWQFP
ncbi:unnamed protein product, partial [Polarella glacialis]